MPPKKKERFSEEHKQNVADAVEAVKKGMTVRAAGEMFSVKKSTLHDHLKGLTKRVHCKGMYKYVCNSMYI